MITDLLKVIFCCLALLFCTRCDKASKSEKSKPAEVKISISSPPVAPPAPVGVITGVVKLTPGAKLPSFPPKLMYRQVVNPTVPASMPKSCSQPTEADRQPVQLTDEGGLVGVLVAVTGFTRFEKRPPVTHDVVIEDCRLKPKFVVATKDDLLRIRSDTDYPFMPDLGDSSILQTLIKGQEKIVRLDHGGTRTILCGFTASCGRTDVVVLYHSLYAVTDTRGAFRIDKVPAGESITVNVWHPLFRAASTVMSVQSNEVRQVSFELSPDPEYTAPPPEPEASPRSRKIRAHMRVRSEEPILK